MPSQIKNLFVLFCLACRVVCFAQGFSESQCSAIFHVWQPGQEAHQMIREVDLKMDNLTSFTRAQISEIKVRLSEELSRVQNWTHTVDKRMLQTQIDCMDDETMQIKFSASSAKVKMQLDRVNRRVADLERSIYNIESQLQAGGTGTSGSATGWPPDHSRPQQQGITEDLGYMLRNSVSDLTSEWILLKRDIEFLKKETARLATKQTQLTNDTVSLKFSLGLTNSDNSRLETRLLIVANQQDKLDSKFEEISIDTESIKRKLEEYRLEEVHRGTNLIAFQARLTAVENHFSELERQLETKPSSESALVLGQEDSRKHPLLTRLESKGESKSRKQTTGNNGTPVAKESINNQEEIFPADCHDVYQNGFLVSSVYQIHVKGARYIVPVYCEMINNTGYTLIQRRIDGTLGFNRGWSEYKHGFGNPYDEFWAGNEFLHLISYQKKYILRIDFWDWNGDQYFAEYSKFYVKGEKDKYKLFVGEFAGSAGDSLSYHNMMAFSTEDVDNDLHERHCAAENKGGWWYGSCFYSQLNGLYHTAWYSQTNFADGVVWYTLKDSEFYSLRKVEMKLKPLPL